MDKTSFFNSLSGRLLLLGLLPSMMVIAAIVTLGALDSYRDLRAAEENVLIASAVGAAAELITRNDR
jgi:hypothetical protein